jgi:hypothetical protein
MAITLLNQTEYLATFEVYKGGLVFAALPALPPGAELVLPTEPVPYEITAEIILNGKHLTSDAVAFEDRENVRLVAQVTEQFPDQPYVFLVLPASPTELRQLQLAKTCKPDVLFRLSRDGQVVQTVLVSASSTPVNLALDDTYGFIAVIDGITVAALTTSNENATITAVARKPGPDGEYFELQLS